MKEDKELTNEEFNTIIFLAFRYSLGRKTSVTNTISELCIKYRHKLSRRNRIQIQNEIEEAIEHKMAGDPCDEHEWKKILELEW